MADKFEYRAIYRSPYASWLEYSEPVDSVTKLPTYHPKSEETHQYVDGFQVRRVSEWEDPRTCLKREIIGPEGIPKQVNCDHIRQIFGDFECCYSCHEDWDDYGYELSRVEFQYEGVDKVAYVCSEAVRKIEKVSGGEGSS